MTDELSRLIAIVAALRDPESGCPWDLEQTHQSLLQHLIEEAYEVVDAVQSQDTAHIEEELGDLLLQVILHAQIASDEGNFTITDVARGISDKLVVRHPHVFGNKNDRAATMDSIEVEQQWEQIKGTKPVGAGIPKSLPQIVRAMKVLKQMRKRQLSLKADIISGKFCSELQELTQESLGNSLLSLINLAIEQNLDPFLALKTATDQLVETANED